MNPNLLMLMIYTLVLLVLFWIIPSQKLFVITKCIKSLLQILPVSQIVKSIGEVFKKK